MKQTKPIVALTLASAFAAAAGSAQSFAGARGAGGGGTGQSQAETKKINVPVVINILKGIGCTDQEMFDLAEAALKRANEVLKQAGVTLTRESIVYNVNDASNADMDAMLQGDEVEQAHNEGVAEVTGEDGLGNPRKGLKITFAKSIEYGGVTDGAGLARECSPWVGIVKSSDDITHDEGETLAHEVGHALGWLVDLEGAENADNLMFWEAKDGSDLKLDDEQKEKIRKGAAAVGEVIDEGEAEEAPKERRPAGHGSATGPITQDPGPDGPDKSVIWVSLRCTGDDLPDPTQPPPDPLPEKYDLGGLLKCWENSDGEQTEGPMLYTIHHGIDSDGDAATGVNVGPFTGVEKLIAVRLDLATMTGDAELTDLINGEVTTFPASVGPPDWFVDGFDALGAPATDMIDSSSVGWLVEFTLPAPGLFGSIGGIGPGVGHIGVAAAAGTSLPVGPGGVDTFIDFNFHTDIYDGRPFITAPGAAQIGEIIQVQGGNCTPGDTLDLFINDDPVAQVVVDPDGAFALPLPLPPGAFGADGHGYDFLKATPSPVGPTWIPLFAVTWISVNAIPGDLNNDGLVNGADLAALLAVWGTGNATADLNGDGLVNGADLATLLANWT